MRTFVALYGGLSLLLAIAYFVPFEQIVNTLSQDIMTLLVFLFRVALWIVVAAVVLLYTPGKLIEAYKKETQEKFYRMDPQPNIDRAYRTFHKLYQEGQVLECGTLELRQQWDQRVRDALCEHCNDECLNIYLTNTGRIDLRTGLDPLKDEKYGNALSHIKWILDKDFDSLIKWPRF